MHKATRCATFGWRRLCKGPGILSRQVAAPKPKNPMPANLPAPVESPHRFAAIVTCDPAAVADCGVAVRMTGSLAAKPARGRLAYPAFTYEGSVWNTRFHDDLANFLIRALPKDGKVLFVCAGTAYGNHAISRSLGRCGGAIESLLVALNVYDQDDLVYVQDKAWRKTELPAHAADPDSVDSAREQWKIAAVDALSTLYGERVGDNLAEAVLLNDHVVLHRASLWAAKDLK